MPRPIAVLQPATNSSQTRTPSRSTFLPLFFLPSQKQNITFSTHSSTLKIPDHQQSLAMVTFFSPTAQDLHQKCVVAVGPLQLIVLQLQTRGLQHLRTPSLEVSRIDIHFLDASPRSTKRKNNPADQYFRGLKLVRERAMKVTPEFVAVASCITQVTQIKRIFLIYADRITIATALYRNR